MNAEIIDLHVQGISYQLRIAEDNPPAKKFRQVFELNGQYEAVMVAILTRLLDTLDAPVFVDLGAFIGYYTCFVAKRLHGRATVFAVESNVRFIENLEETLRLNKLDNVRLFHAALSDHVEQVWADGTAVVREGASSNGLAMTTTTFDTLCADAGLRPNIAKMDVHGAEGKIIGGMPHVLSHSLEYLLLELHPNAYLRKYGPGITRMRILDLLEEAGFRTYYVAGHRYTWSDGMQVFFDTGRFAYQPLTRQTRGMLLFDRHNQMFILASKRPLEGVLGPSILDPSQE